MMEEQPVSSKLQPCHDLLPANGGDTTEQVSGQCVNQKKDAARDTPGKKRHFWHHIWLTYSVFMLLPLFYQHSTRFAIDLAIAFPLFILFYFGAWHDSTLTRRRLWTAAMLLHGVIYAPMNPSSVGTFIFVASVLPFVVKPPKIVFTLLGAQCLCIAAETWIFHFEAWTWIIGGALPFVVALNNLRVAQQRRADAKLRLAHAEVENLAKLAERERIARDLHDVLGHTLSLIVLKSELAQRINLQDPERASREMQDVEQTARQALADVRHAISGYRSEGIRAELDRTRHMLDAAGIAFHCDSRPPKLAATEEAVLSLIVREAVTNIVRHSQAKVCRVLFDNAYGTTTLTIQDDGRGGATEEGNGIRGMRERVEALGGTFDVLSRQGTKLQIKLPRPNGINRLL